MRTLEKRLLFCLFWTVLLGSVTVVLSLQSTSAAPAVPLDTPRTMVFGVTGKTVYKSVVYWYNNPFCEPVGPANTAVVNGPVTIWRQRTTDSATARRILFSRQDPPQAGCNPYRILSNLAVDDDYIYWLDAQGLARIPHTSNPGDPVERVINVHVLQPGELVNGGDHIYGSFEGHLFRYNKVTGEDFSLGNSISLFTQLQYDGVFLYYLLDSRLIRRDPADNYRSFELFPDISTYAAPGYQKVCGDGANQWLSSNSGTASFRYLFRSFTSLGDLRFGDFDGDGKTDVFAAAPQNNGTLQWVYSAAGESGFIPLNFADTPLADLRFGDFDGDGKTDVFTAIEQSAGVYQWYYSSGGTGNYVALNYANIPLEALRFGDFNGDGKTDVFALLPRQDGNLQWAYSSAGTGNFVNLNYANLPLEALRFADFTGDGVTDVFTAELTGNGVYQWKVSNGGITGFVNMEQSAQPLENLRFGDFNGDGRADVFTVQQRPDGNWQWLYSSGAFGAFQELAFGAQPLEELRLGDFNGDGKTDVFTTLPRTGCKDVLPLFYGITTTDTPGVGGNIYWWDMLTQNYGSMTTTPKLLPGTTKSFNYYDGITFADNRLFWTERYSNCTDNNCTLPTTSQLYRANVTLDFYRGYSRVATDLLWQEDATVRTPSHWPRTGLTADDRFVVWNFYPNPGLPDPDGKRLYRLDADAAALPMVNIRLTGLEITQGIQNRGNTVRLIQGRGTFVRVFAKSDGVDVADVNARLTLIVDGVNRGTIEPERRIKVVGDPDYFDTDQSFLFHLPLWAVMGNTIQVHAHLNPDAYPVEPVGGLNDNTLTSAVFGLDPSPQMNVLFAEFTYSLYGKTYRPQGTWSNVNWILYTYPLGHKKVNGGYEPGLVWDVVKISDPEVAIRVDRRLPQCEPYVERHESGPIIKDDREFCASDYVNSRLAAIRYRFGLPSTTFAYGEIPDTTYSTIFPRGQAREGLVASGPDAVRWNGYYAGHEIGHMVGLGHPQQSIIAGLMPPQLGDPIPSYPRAQIGPNNDSVNGFAYAYSNASGRWRYEVLRGSQWFDMMTYSKNPSWPIQWISDENYARIYRNLRLTAADRQQETQVGDFLAIFGSIAPTGDQAAIAFIERWPELMIMPDSTAGELSLRQYNGSGQLLSAVSFAAEEHGVWRPFELVVPAEAGVARLEIVRVSDALVLAEQMISANAPTVSVPTAVLNGEAIQLTWTGADADGDTLRYDLFVSRDGELFAPVQFGLPNGRATVATADIGGGSLVFRVVANDGVQTAAHDSAPLDVPARPPEIRGFDPACGFQLNWGQTANLTVDVRDPQDGLLPAANLQWQLNGVTIGTGYWQSYVSELRAGENVATLQATNSDGLTTTADCDFFVGDDLSVPAAELSVTPGQVSWQVTSDDLVVQTAELSLVNLGDGVLTWTANSTDGWLSLGKTAGEVPDTLHIEANPSALNSPAVYATTVTISAYDEDGILYQTIDLPVTLWLDQSGYAPPETITRLFLPFISRPD